MVVLSSRSRISLLLALLAIASLAAAGAAGAAGRGAYPAKLTVAGEMTVTTSHDFTGPCEKGQAWTITAKASVNVSSRIQLEWITHGGIVQGTEARTQAGAINRNSLSGYAETNLCEDPVPFEESEKPQCSSHAGAGIADVGGSKGKISIGIARQGGGEQEASCHGGFVVRPKPTGTRIGTLQSDSDQISLPLGVGVGPFKKLRVGQKLSRRIQVKGPCQLGALATTSIFREDVCTVSGSFTVTVRRLPGKGRSGFTTARAR